VNYNTDDDLTSEPSPRWLPQCRHDKAIRASRYPKPMPIMPRYYRINFRRVTAGVIVGTLLCVAYMLALTLSHPSR
jgi:hypothetical protein